MSTHREAREALIGTIADHIGKWCTGGGVDVWEAAELALDALLRDPLLKTVFNTEHEPEAIGITVTASTIAIDSEPCYRIRGGRVFCIDCCLDVTDGWLTHRCEVAA